MWQQGEASEVGAGGFMASAVDYPAVGAGRKSKGRASQTIMPVSVKQLLECQDDAFKIEGFEAHFVTVVGLVRVVESTSVKVSMYVDDQTGTIECIKYVGAEDTADGPTVIREGSYGRFIGIPRSPKGQKYLIVFKSEAIVDLNEITCHGLEVIQTNTKLKKFRNAEDNKTVRGGPLDNTFSNYMKGEGSNGAKSAGGTAMVGANHGLTANQNLLRGVIANARDEVGMHRDHIIAAVKDQITQKEVLDILEFLSNEGHVYSTVDDDHYKSTSS